MRYAGWNSPTSVKTKRDVVDGEFGSNTRRRREQVQDETRGHGRARTRDPDIRSSSARRGQSSPRATYEHRHHERECGRGRARMSAAQRARIDSVQKVAEWLSSSPVIAGAPAPLRLSSYTLHHHYQNQRRNSSPKARRVKYEFVEALTRELKGHAEKLEATPKQYLKWLTDPTNPDFPNHHDLQKEHKEVIIKAEPFHT
ncbi:hypothetical protein BC629DRAFT_1598423 [Irpex lacteus]|nr:hypothetical protein BC629DRAFT_1598423 [Irpex lacteus]